MKCEGGILIAGLGAEAWPLAAENAGHFDRLLKRLHKNKPELLMVLQRPEIPLHTDGSENDFRAQVTKRDEAGLKRKNAVESLALAVLRFTTISNLVAQGQRRHAQ